MTAKHPLMHRTASMTKDNPAPNVSSAEAREHPCLRSAVLKPARGGSPNSMLVERHEAPTFLNIPGDSGAAASVRASAILALGTSRALAITSTQELFQADPGGVRVSLQVSHLAKVTKQFWMFLTTIHVLPSE